ncbi:MAG: glucose-6-phosphate dehydrogenase [Saprospiraceae bacterium]|nr:glucose-6-phosphate dehydrogenase [Saprospiraceae bacterium]
MKNENATAPTIFLIFGATGDLTYRKLMPALYNLILDDMLPESFSVVGIGRSDMNKEQLMTKLKEGAVSFSRRPVDDEKWTLLCKNFGFINGDFADPALYENVNKAVNDFKAIHPERYNVIVYLAVSPVFFGPITKNLAPYSFIKRRDQTRFVFEKPFGHDLQSALDLNKEIMSVLRENQIYRIDHYLGKETVQNILAFRFANSFFEPLWNKNYIEWIQISSLEKVGLEGRGGYYDNSGALRDMIQNHMLQLMCMIAMEPPISFAADEIRNKKADVLHAVRKYSEQEVFQYTARGQYGAGKIGDEVIPAYRTEKNVRPDSNTETYAAAVLHIETWRWEGVPFYIRTGKNLSQKATTIAVKFKPAPSYSFPKEATNNWKSNLLVFNINPKMDIHLMFQAKVPGQMMQLSQVNMEFDFEKELTANTPEAYEHLIYDVLEGDATLFMRSDQVEAAWQIINPILNAWQNNKDLDFPNYAPGSNGPVKSDELLAKYGHTWLNP